MSIRFTEEQFDIKDLAKSELSGVNQFLLENNKKQLECIFEYYNSNKPLLLVNGFLGSGKTQIVKHSLKFLQQETIVLEYTCFETTILDDILLSFFEDFKNLEDKELIDKPKIKSENFTQKITSYFETITKPIVIVINSYEIILKNNKQDILDFFTHISQKSNIKIIITSRMFNYEEFSERFQFEKVTILALEKSLFEKFLRSEGIKSIGPVSDELYKHTRGYYLYVKLSVEVITAKKLSLIDFIKNYTKSFLTYNDFILREILLFVDPVNWHLIRLLTIIRHPINIKFLETINLYDEDKIKFFVKISILSLEKNLVYLPDYYKDIAGKSIPESVAAKLHKSCMELYSTQLPLKPFERDILISRKTMRAEIDYHVMFLPKNPMLVSQMQSAAIEAIEYAATLNSNYQDIPVAANDIISNPEVEIIVPDVKKEKLKNISFIFDNETEEKQIMDEIASSINTYIDYSDKTISPEETKLPFMEIINRATKEVQNFNIKKAIAFYQLALTKKDDENYSLIAPKIYTKTALCYEKLSDWFNALKYYNLALEFFIKIKDVEKINEVRLSIANVFYNTYKHDKAIKLLEDILSEKEISNELKIKTYLALAAIKSNNIDDAYKYYKMAFDLVEPDTSKKVLSELYCKLGAIYDEINEVETAIELYKKCISITQPQNLFLASAMNNIAMIYDDMGEADLAVKYFTLSLKLNEKTKNYSEIYEAAIRLAKIYRRKSPEIATDNYRKALYAAKELSDPYYLMYINIEYGDFCSDRKDFAKAIKAYIRAMNKTNNKTLEEYKPKIEQRLKDLKTRVGDIEYEKLLNEVINNG